MSLHDFKNAIGALSKAFGQEQIKNEAVTTLKEKAAPNRRKPTLLKWHLQSQVIEKKDRYQYLNPDVFRFCTRLHLKEMGYEFIMSRFFYQGTAMDIFSMANNRVIEFQVVADRIEFAGDFKKVYRLGSIVVNKHTSLETGKALPNFFFFVAPAGMLDLEEVPAHTGLIEAYVPSGKVLPVFRLTKAARMLHAGFLPPGTWKTIAQSFERRMNDMQNRYERNTFSKFPWDRGEQENKLQL